MIVLMNVQASPQGVAVQINITGSPDAQARAQAAIARAVEDNTFVNALQSAG